MDPVQTPVVPDNYAVKVVSFSAEYRKSSSDVYLTWAPPAGGDQVDLYQITRFYGLGQDGSVDGIKKTWIDASENAFADAPDLERGYYSYLVRPAKMYTYVNSDGNTVYDTIAGLPSDTVEVLAGMGLRFFINRGALATKDTSCSLFVTTLLNNGVSVKFKNDKSGAVPDFGGAVNYSLSGVDNQFSWVLDTFTAAEFLEGRNRKVYAEIVYTYEGVNYTDTLAAEIAVAGYSIKFTVANERVLLVDSTRTGKSDATVVWQYGTREGGLHGQESWELYVFNSKSIQFIVSTGDDPTFVPEFEYWIITPDSAVTFEGSNWEILESVHAEGKLQDNAGTQIFEYDYDPETVAGKKNFAKFFQSSSGSFINSGSSADDNFARFFGLPVGVGSGKKEISVVFRFKGRFFKDERYFVTTGILSRTDSDKRPDVDWFNVYEAGEYSLSGTTASTSDRIKEYYVDYYVPSIALPSSQNAEYLNNGDTVTQLFDFVMNADGSVSDVGLARVTSLSLIVAKYPEDGEKLSDGTVWNDTLWDPQSWISKQILPPVTLDDLYKFEHFILPYDIWVPQITISGIRWEDINPYSWDAGKYLVGIIAGDEYGNSGLAQLNLTGKQSNPFRLVVVNGK